jgi:hypothetical protein
MLGICKRTLRVTEHPEGYRSVTQDCRPGVLAKTRRQPAMLGRIVEREGAIEMLSAFRDVTGGEQGVSREAMPKHERGGCPLLLGESQELRRELAHYIAVERHKVRDLEAMKNRK